MKIRILGGGPAGLTFAGLMKQQDPTHDIVVFERGPRDATWGFGVVFSDRALEFLRADDEALCQLLTPHMETWKDLTIVHNDTRVPIAGNGFASIGRLELLKLLYTHVESLGVRIAFQTEITSLDHPELAGADLVVAANGAFSWVRAENEARFGTTTDWRPNRFIWYGTTKPFDTLTLTFRDTPHGVFCAHHYRYSPGLSAPGRSEALTPEREQHEAGPVSTFLVEVEEQTWQRAGFQHMSPQDTIGLCEEVFAQDLGGHRIVSNHSYWRNFPAIWNERWSFGHVVLMGDALRTAHFSIGSGTRLAMEDALALAKAFREQPRVADALKRYQALRQPPMKKIWDAANVSLRWYEQMGTHMALHPVDFAYSYMTRTGRVDHAEVRRRDPGLAAAYEVRHPDVAME